MVIKSDSRIDNIQYEPTEGEEFILDFFNSEGIKYVPQKRIENLKGDTYSYRVADFYIPKYKLYVEFLGMWNTNEKKKQEYREKKHIYALNRIPCIYLYPENLGIIHYSFNKRARSVLRQYNMKKELFKFNLYLFLKNHTSSVIGFLICFSLLITFQFDRGAEYYWQWSGIITAGLILYIRNIIRGYIRFFKKDYSYVTFVRE